MNNPIQDAFDKLSAVLRSQRSRVQMTLGELEHALELLNPSAPVVGIGEPDSYRGYYADLAFEPDGNMTAEELLKVVRGCIGRTFTGYKGGDFKMERNAPLWVASYGSCGMRLMGLRLDEGQVTPILKEEE